MRYQAFTKIWTIFPSLWHLAKRNFLNYFFLLSYAASKKILCQLEVKTINLSGARTQDLRPPGGHSWGAAGVALLPWACCGGWPPSSFWLHSSSVCSSTTLHLWEQQLCMVSYALVSGAYERPLFLNKWDEATFKLSCLFTSLRHITAGMWRPTIGNVSVKEKVHFFFFSFFFWMLHSHNSSVSVWQWNNSSTISSIWDHWTWFRHNRSLPQTPSFSRNPAEAAPSPDHWSAEMWNTGPTGDAQFAPIHPKEWSWDALLRRWRALRQWHWMVPEKDAILFW